MPRPPIAELSLRHLPDISDTSLQISFADNLDDLLANNDDFLDGTDDSISTPGAEKSGQDLLTLSQLTPRPPILTTNAAASATSVTVIPRPHFYEAKQAFNKHLHHQTAATQTRDVNRLATPQTTGQVEPRSTKTCDVTALVTNAPPERLHHSQEKNAETLAGARTFGRSDIRWESALPHPESRVAVSATASHAVHSVRTKRKHKKPTVTANAIFKSLDKLPKSGFVRAIANKPKSDRRIDTIVHETQFSPDIVSVNGDPGLSRAADVSICSTAPGPVAEKLLQYGQNLVTSFGLSNSEGKNSDHRGQELPTVSQDFPREDSLTIYHSAESLTLADLSPQRSTDVGPDQGVVQSRPPALPKSPMRALKKRAYPDSASSPKQSRKKSKTHNAVSDTMTLQPSVRSNIVNSNRSGSGSSLGSDNSVNRGKNANSRGSRRVARTINGKGMEGPGFSIRAKDIQPSQRKKGIGAQNMATFQNAPESRGSGCLPYDEGPKMIPTRTNPTGGVAFNSRLEEKEKTTTGSTKVHNRHPIPDFKTLHAAQEAKLATLRDKNTPVLPLPLHLSTDDRMRERRKFDEMVKEKEKEQERAIEERRKQREEEEEREIRELRRRAVPKAHDVPEWYATAPRKETGG